jgi:hypothetical protein
MQPTILLTEQERDFIKSNWSGLNPTEFNKQDPYLYKLSVSRLDAAIKTVHVLNPSAFTHDALVNS